MLPAALNGGTGRIVLKIATTSSHADLDLMIFRESGSKLISVPFTIDQGAVELPTGYYTFQTKCSHKRVRVIKDKSSEISLHHLEFKGNFPADDEAVFDLKCLQSGDKELNRSYQNQYAFDFFEGHHHLKIGLDFLDLHFKNEGEESLTQKIPLASIFLTQPNRQESQINYARAFVSKDQAQVTIPIQLGIRYFFLHGDYILESFGTFQEIELAQDIHIEMAQLQVVAPALATKRGYDTIRGNPLFLMVNGRTQIYLGRKYWMLPGRAVLSIGNFNQSIRLDGGENRVLALGSLELQSRCEQTLHGYCVDDPRKVYIYPDAEEDKWSLQAMSFVPQVLFPGRYKISLEGNKDLQKDIVIVAHQHQKIPFLRLEMVPIPEYGARLETDLVRLEANDLDLHGKTLDIDLTRRSKILLFPGLYHLVRFDSRYNKNDMERKKTPYPLRIAEQESLDLRVLTFESKKVAEK